MSDAPVVSVLMPVYNAERYVAEAVESILCQTLRDFEFIIVDDGSTDGSLSILKGYAERDPRIRLISRPNTGYVAALNEMLEHVRGEFIARMDADDVAMPLRFELQVDYLRRQPECVAVGGAILLIDSDGDPLCPWSSPLSHEAIDAAHLRGRGGSLPHPTAMIRREAILAVDGYRQEREPAEDVDLFLRLAESGRLANLSELILKYRRHVSSVGYSRRQQQIEALNMAIREAHQRRGLEKEALPMVLPETETDSDNHRVWSWWALGAGNVATARKHALASLCHSPLSLGSWRVVYCTLRGY